MTEIDRTDIEARLADGESLRAIAATYGVTHQTLQYHRRRWGAGPLRGYPRRGVGHQSWKGGSFIDKRYGYRMVLAPENGRANKYVAEHVLIVEAAIGRKLTRAEVVHHINGNKLDNRQDNLLVCSRSLHKQLHFSLEAIGYELMRRGRVSFDGDAYRLTD